MSEIQEIDNFSENRLLGLNGLFCAASRFAAALNAAHSWYKDNEPKIVEFLKGFAMVSLLASAANRLADHQVIFTDDIDITFAKQVLETENIDNLIEHYYFEDSRINRVLQNCRNSNRMSPYSILFSEIECALWQEHFQLTCLGLFAILDGLLADITQKPKCTSFKPRIETIKNKLTNNCKLSKLDKKILCIAIALQEFENSVFSDSDFSKEEPSNLNRHWVVHGRTRKKYTRCDCIKLLLWIDAILFISNLEP